MRTYKRLWLDDTDDSDDSDDYSDTESYCSAEGGYELPRCGGCQRYAYRWISGTHKNPDRPFLVCPKPIKRQCPGRFIWEDVYLAKISILSRELCDECLEDEREIPVKIGSSKVDDKASLDRVKDEPLDKNGYESGMPLFGKVKDEPSDKNGDESGMPQFGKVKDEPSDQDGNESGKPQVGKVKDEPSDQDGNGSGYVADSLCKRCGEPKHKIDEIGSARDDNKASLVKDKPEQLTKLETGNEISAELYLNPNSKRMRYNGADNFRTGSRVMESDRMSSNGNQKVFIKQENHEGFETPSLQLAPQVGYATRPGHRGVDVLAVPNKGEGCSTNQQNANVMEYAFFPGCSKNKEDELKFKKADENHLGTCLDVAAGATSIDLSLKLS